MNRILQFIPNNEAREFCRLKRQQAHIREVCESLETATCDRLHRESRIELFVPSLDEIAADDCASITVFLLTDPMTIPVADLDIAEAAGILAEDFRQMGHQCVLAAVGLEHLVTKGGAA